MRVLYDHLIAYGYNEDLVREINEAFYTVEEGTAIEQDIDQAMKLGTNYPAGPFEMASTIGLPNICKLLSALERSTGDSRYKICPLLRKQACD